MQPLIWEHRPDGLRAPALVCAFTGWNDAGDAASAALQFLGASLQATRFARIYPEDFFDFQATRPKIKLVEGRTRSIEWPEVEIYAARVPRAPRDLVLLQGAEPSMRWRSFCRLIVDLAEALGTQMVVTLGALLADSPHTRPVPVSGTASDPETAAELRLEASRYEGPTGIVGVFQDACTQTGMRAVSFWAAVPHYVATPPCPKATIALLRRVEDLLDIPVPLGDLPERARAWERQVDELAAEDSDVAEYIASLEEREPETDLPEASGEAIAKEFERYLRRRDDPPGR